MNFPSKQGHNPRMHQCISIYKWTKYYLIQHAEIKKEVCTIFCLDTGPMFQKPTNKWLGTATVSLICKYIYKIHNKAILCYENKWKTFFLSSNCHHPLSINPSLLCSMLQICRWGRHSSQATTSLSNSNGTRVHNQEFQSSLGSYNHPAKPKKTNVTNELG